LFCDAKNEATCDEETAEHRSTLSVRLSHEDAETNEAINFHSEISQHISQDGIDIAKVHSGEFFSGQRICMTSFVIGPKQLTSQIEVEIVDAWLCFVDQQILQTLKDNELVCDKSEYKVFLVRTSENSTDIVLNELYNVTIQHPGAYGLLSIGVCYDANARFTDSEGRSLISSEQRFESRIRMQPATIRRTGAIHVSPMYFHAAQLSEDSSRLYDPVILSLAIHAEHQSLQNQPFVVAALRKAIDAARISGAATEIHGHSYTVYAADIDHPAVSDSEQTIGLVIIFAVIVAIGIVIACWLASGKLENIASRID